MQSLHHHHRIRKALAAFIESMESRTLLSATLLSQIPATTVPSGSTPTTINLGTYFSNPAGTVVQFTTPLGNIDIELTDTVTPLTVANFLGYINSGEYASTIVHRVVPNFIIQGGGYTTSGSHITQSAPVQGENPNDQLHNTTGTISMALPGGANSANSGTSEWFINLANNTSLDTASNPGQANNQGPFTPFGHVLGNGLTIANTIANTGEVDASAQNGAWTNLPVTASYTGATATSGTIPAANANPLPAADFVTNAASVLTTLANYDTSLTYTAASSNTAAIGASISNGVLTLTPAAGVTTGASSITVTAADAYGDTVTSTFNVGVNGLGLPITISNGGTKFATYTDADGTTATLTLKGAGSATINFASASTLTQTPSRKGVIVSGSGATIGGITTTGTNGASVLSITTKGGTKFISIGGLTTQSLKSITGKGVNLTGAISTSGAIGSLALASISNGTLAAPSVGSIVTTGDFSDGVSLTGTGVDLNKFQAGSVSGGTWLVAGSIKSISDKGNFSATIDAGSITTLNVKGGISNGGLQLTASGADLKTLTVGGGISSSEINAAGSLGNLSAANLSSSEIYAGVGNLVVGQVLPNFATDFITTQSIASVKLKNAGAGAASFTNSNIAAANIAKLQLGTLQTSNGGNVTGVATEHLKLFTAIANKKFTLKNLDNSANLTSILTADGVTLGDFVIKLF